MNWEELNYYWSTLIDAEVQIKKRKPNEYHHVSTWEKCIFWVANLTKQYVLEKLNNETNTYILDVRDLCVCV